VKTTSRLSLESPPESFLKAMEDLDPSTHVWSVKAQVTNPNTGGTVLSAPFTHPLSTPFERLFEGRKPGNYQVKILPADGGTEIPKKGAAFYVEVLGKKGWKTSMEGRHEDRIEGAVASAEEARARVEAKRADLDLRRLEREERKLEHEETGPEEGAENPALLALQSQVEALREALDVSEKEKMRTQIESLRDEIRRAQEPKTNTADLIASIGAALSPVVAAFLESRRNTPTMLEQANAVSSIMRAFKDGAPGLRDQIGMVKEILELSDMMGGGGGDKSDLGQILSLVRMVRGGEIESSPRPGARMPAMPAATVPGAVAAPPAAAGPGAVPAAAPLDEKRKRCSAFLIFLRREIEAGTDPNVRAETIMGALETLPAEIVQGFTVAGGAEVIPALFAPYVDGSLVEGMQMAIRMPGPKAWLEALLAVVRHEFAEGNGVEEPGVGE
jgi:hypothetical protein